MKFKLQLVCEPGENETACTDEIFTFDKPFDTFENIGLSLCESKQLLEVLQAQIVQQQANNFLAQELTKLPAGRVLKDYQSLNYAPCLALYG